MSKAVIVGGGIAGLTCAAYLARDGHQVKLIEKNSSFGGLVSSIEDNGFHFEAGVRALVNAGIILPMLKDLDINLDKVKNNVTIGVEKEFLHIEGKQDVLKYRDFLIKLYPLNSKEIDRFIKIMNKIIKYFDILYGIDNPLFKDLQKDREFLFTKLLPWLPGFILTLRKIKRLQLPVEEYLARIITNTSLLDIITQHFFKATPTFFALGYFSIYLDYFYPIGGVGTLSQKVENKVVELGGELVPNTTIEKINTYENYIVDQKGKRYYYDNLVWAADLKTFYSIADEKSLHEKSVSQFKKYKEKIANFPVSESVFSLYLEINMPLSYFKTISKGHFFYTPRKKGLGNIHRKELENLLINFNHTDRNKIEAWLDRMLEYNTFEISIPGLRDGKLSPQGKTGMIVSFLTGYEIFKKVKEAGWYDEFVNEIEGKIISLLSKTIYPSLQDNVIKHFSFTPLTIQSRVGTEGGAIVGWAFEKNIPAITQMGKVSKAVDTPLPHIYQAGQWTYSPAGVPMSILTGKLAANRIAAKK